MRHYDLAVVIPTRGRPRAVEKLSDVFRESCAANTGLVFVVDDDDECRGEYAKAAEQAAGWPVEIVSGGAGGNGMVRGLNLAATELAGRQEPPYAIAFMGDDHRPRTRGWDLAYLRELRAGAGLVYGDDLVHGVGLPTQVAIRTEIVRALGYMAPPQLRHLYVDNAWLAWGRAAGCIAYLPEVVVEHMHPLVGKAPSDPGYERVNAPAVYEADRIAYQRYCNSGQQAADIAVIRRVMGR